MTEPLKRPGKKLGGISTKWWILGGGAAALTVWYVWKKQTASAAATATTDTTGTDTTSTDPYGATYASSYGTPSAYGYQDPTTGQFIGLGGQASNVITAPPTNAAWFQQAEAYLVAQGYDPLTTGAALGKYLAGQALTQTEMTIVTAAIGAEGQPPTAVPAPHTIPPTAVPPPAAKQPFKAPSLVVYSRTKTGGVLAWTITASGAGAQYHIHRYVGGVPILIGGTAHNKINVPKGIYSVSAWSNTNHSPESNKVTV